MGEPGLHGGPAGNLLVSVQVEPDERFHHEMGVKFLRELATDADSQALARAARLRTIELAEELQNLAYTRAKIHHAPGC